MSATARVPTGPLRARTTSTHSTSTRTASTRTASTRTATTRTATTRTATTRTATPRPGTTRRTGPVHVRPQLRLVTGPVDAPVRARRTAAARPRRTPFVVLVVALIAVTALGLLALNTAIAVDSLAASQQRAANTELAKRVDRLEQQVTEASAPAELAAAAVAAGLVPADTAGHLVLGEDGTSVVRGEPVPAPAPEPAPEAAADPAAGAPATDAPAPDATPDPAGD